MTKPHLAALVAYIEGAQDLLAHCERYRGGVVVPAKWFRRLKQYADDAMGEIGDEPTPDEETS